MKQKERFTDLVVYQIYPKSFKDSNNDGIGDINGIIEKLDYLHDLGINAIWLCPCYKSPYHDNGYDISDYRCISEDFGTMEDLKHLIREMHARDMRLIMDLVPNHTSNEHEWFIASRNREGKYADYYYWFDEPVNDWEACFGGSAWQYDEVRKQYYLHSYTVEQPDLNWDNPDVVKEMQDVIDFWVSLGVDGFRCDVIDQISKDFEHEKNCFGPHLHEYIHAMFGRPETDGIFTVGECWATDIDEVWRHIAPEREELTTLFQFEHLDAGREGKFTPKIDSLKSVRDIVIKWQTATQDRGLLYSLLTDNHDQSLYISRVANDKELRYESATCLATMFYLLRGIPFLYQGQEIGMTASEYDSIDFFDDIECINAYHTFLEEGLSEKEAIRKINFGSRDNPRRPFAWDNSKYAGFSEHTPWLPIASRAKEINLENDLRSEKSVFRFYRTLLKLRKESPAFRKGTFTVVSKPEDEYFIYARTYESDTFTVICNFDKPTCLKEISSFGVPVLYNYQDYHLKNETLRPYEVVVLKNKI